MKLSVEFSQPEKKAPFMTLVLLLIIIAGIAGARTWMQRSETGNPFTAAVRKSAKIQLYYPRHLRKGYTMSKHAVTQPSDDVVIITLKNTRGRTIYISQEPLPEKFDIQNLYKNFSDASDIPAPIGHIKIGNLRDSSVTRTIVSIVTYDSPPTWLIINGSADTPSTTLVSLAKELVPNK
jgi:hypothetical protein